MDRGDGTMFDPDVVLKNFDDWRKAVCRAAGSGDDPVFVRVICVTIYAKNDVCRIAILNRRRDNDLFHSGIKIRVQRSLGLENTRAIDDDIDSFKRQIPNVRD